MKKILIITAVLAMSATSSFGQLVRFGVKTGITFPSTDITNRIDPASTLKSNGAGFALGVLSRVNIPLTGIFVQPELIYNNVGYKLREGGNTNRKTYSNLEMPVLVGMNLLFVRVNAGPVFNIATFNSSNTTIHRPNVGYQLGVGLTLSDFDFDIRWQGDFRSRVRDFTTENVVNDIKVNGRFWVISLAYLFR